MTSTATIYNSMANQVVQQEALEELGVVPDTATQLLADVNSQSRVSFHRLLMWIVAYITKLTLDQFDMLKVETVEAAKDRQFGTRRWFVSTAKAFQYGDTLVFDDLDAHYATDNPSARIVAQAAVVELANVVIVKVAKRIGIGLYKLANDEALALQEYFDQLRPPVQVSVLTANADELRVYGSVIYDAQQSLPGVQAAVVVAMRTYVQSLSFGGAFRTSDLLEAMRAVSGVVDVQFTQLEARSAVSGPYQPIGRIYYPYAGHMQVSVFDPITTTMEWQAGLV